MRLFQELTESRMFPAGRSSLSKWDGRVLADVLYLNICALRILLSEAESRDWARTYCGKTDHDIRHWRSNASDMFVILHGLDISDVKVPVEIRTIRNWLGNAQRGQEEIESRYATSVFTRLDTMLGNRNASMSAIRRLLLEWEELSLRERRLSVTRLLQFMRAKCPKSDLLPELEKAARRGRYEMVDVCNPETGEGCGSGEAQQAKKPSKFGFIAGLAGSAAGYALGRHKTNEASDGATTSANIAIVPGALGAGFDPKGHKGIYEVDEGDEGDEDTQNSKPTGREGAVLILRRKW